MLIVDEHQSQPRRTGAADRRLEAGLRQRQLGHGRVAQRLVAAARAGRPYDVAILDMDLERTSGLSLAAAIKADPATRATRILLVSADRLAADPVQRREAGVAYQLIKPVRAGDLFECIATRPRKGVAAAPRRRAAAAGAPGRQPARACARCCWPRTTRSTSKWPPPCSTAWAWRCSCARNGEEALQAVRAGQYDVVLMDCQMPVMDGFAATAEIRRYERENGRARNLPIIAITANALQGDRESCLAAGMDDYLSKPFTQQQLGAVIGRWIALPLAAAPSRQTSRAPRRRWPPPSITTSSARCCRPKRASRSRATSSTCTRSTTSARCRPTAAARWCSA